MNLYGLFSVLWTLQMMEALYFPNVSKLNIFIKEQKFTQKNKTSYHEIHNSIDPNNSNFFRPSFC